jgi:hypothetical protein
MRCISVTRSLYFRIFSASFFITFLSPGIATSIIIIIIIIIVVVVVVVVVIKVVEFESSLSLKEHDPQLVPFTFHTHKPFPFDAPSG